jgi:hypothetical protein
MRPPALLVETIVITAIFPTAFLAIRIIQVFAPVVCGRSTQFHPVEHVFNVWYPIAKHATLQILAQTASHCLP